MTDPTPATTDLAAELERVKIRRDIAAGARDAERQIAAELRRRAHHLERVAFVLALRIGDSKADVLDSLSRALRMAETARDERSADVYRDALQAIEDAEEEQARAALPLTPNEPARPAEAA